MKCGKWLKDVGVNASFPDCGPWDDWPTWTQDMKTGIMQFVMGSMDAMHMPGYFFWTWKVRNVVVRLFTCCETDSFRHHEKIDWQLLYHRHPNFSNVVLPTWSRKWLDAHRPP